MAVQLYEQISRNRWKSRILLALVFLLVLAVCFFFVYLINLGIAGVLLAVILAIGYSFFGYYYSDQLVLKVSGARPVDKNEYPYLYNTIQGLALAAGLPEPKMYVIDDPAPNAFATGRDPQHSAIAVTTGLLQLMDRQELEGVLGHEMAHIKNYDIRFATLTIVLVGMIAIMGDLALRMLFFGGGQKRDSRGGGGILMIVGIVFIVLSPIIAQLVRLAISRKREFLADAEGAKLTRYPDGLASALEKLKNADTKVKSATETTAPIYFANPVKGKLSGLFATHPPLDERIKALRAM